MLLKKKKNQNKEKEKQKQNENKYKNIKILPNLLKYVKPEAPIFIISLILISFVTLIHLSLPVTLMVAIDDIVSVKDRKISVYENYEDLTGIKIGDNFYSSISHYYKKPDQQMRIIEHEGKHFWMPLDIKFDDKSKIIKTNKNYFLQNGDNINAINHVSKEFQSKFSAKNYENLRNLSLIFIILLIFQFLADYIQSYLISRSSQKIVNEIRKDLFSHILSLDLDYFEHNPVGSLVTRVVNDVTNLSRFFSQVLLLSIKDLAMIVGVVIMMYKLNFTLANALSFYIPITIVILFIYRKATLKIQRILKVKLSLINSKLAEYISGVRIIQSFNVEEEYSEKFDQENESYKRTNFKMVNLQAFFIPLNSLINQLAVITILFIGGTGVINGIFKIGMVVAFTKYSNTIYKPLIEFSKRFEMFSSAIASMERIFYIKSLKPSVVDVQHPVKIADKKYEIEFKNVYFSYNYKKEDLENKMDKLKANAILKDLSFKINPGESVAIVGHTGSGKTTICSLINRFYDIFSGSILVDGVDIREIEISELRKNISMVHQDVYMFSSTVKNNISLFDENITYTKVLESSKKVSADDFIKNLNNGYDHVLKEKGADFSSGERQLISFARAIAHDPKVLILDEATSSIDSETEMLIQKAINILKKGRTMLIIAHRLSTIKDCDKILVLDKGKLIELGTHDELIKKGGAYSKLVKIDYKEAD